jgi:hypothetical protein
MKSRCSLANLFRSILKVQIPSVLKALQYRSNSPDYKPDVFMAVVWVLVLKSVIAPHFFFLG